MIRARKRFGQHFLHDPKVLARIVAAIDPRAGERVVEIGPGRGALTELLLAKGPRLTAIEIDRDLGRELAARFGTRLELIVTDALSYDFAALAGAGPALRIVGNLPYNISTPLLFHLLEARSVIHDMHFMLQKEVVERMAAQPGNKDYGRLTVMLAPWLIVEPLFTVGPGAFQPPPRVSSAIVRLTVRAQVAFDMGEAAHFETVVRTAFSQRRKTLLNALRGVVEPAAWQRLDIDPGLRPERLTPEQFGRIAREMTR